MTTLPPTAPRLGYPAYLGHIRRESRRFRDVLAACDPAAPVPACPGWTAADLLWHLTEVQWFWAHTVRARPAAPDEDGPRPARPQGHAALLDAFDEHSAGLLAELGAADPGEAAWHWAPEQTVGTSYRRQAHEALIHRLDAEQAAGTVTPLDPRLAGDGVLELLDVMYGGEPPVWADFEAGPHHVRVDLADLGASIWTRPGTLRGTDPSTGRSYDGPHVLVVADPRTGPDAVVAGPAGDLDAWLWHRRGADGIDVSGDRSAYDALRASVSEPLD